MQGINTVNDLRTILAEEIQNIRDGKTTAANVNAIVNATGKILTTVKMEIEYNKLIGKTPRIDFISGPATPPELPQAS
jgi:flagellar biosynthesis/type III secretory pathway chaperone